MIRKEKSIMATEFIHIENDALKKLYAVHTEYDRKVYFTLCNHATFKHKVFGVYKHQTFSTLNNLIDALTKDKKQVQQLQRSITKLEKSGLIKVLEKKNELIIALDTNLTMQDLKFKIENQICDFNIWADRIGELEKNLGFKFNIRPVFSKQELEKLADEIPF